MRELLIYSSGGFIHSYTWRDYYNSILSSALGMFFAVVPVIPVAISAGIIHDQYGTEE